MYTLSVRLALLSLLVGLWSAVPARADYVYTYTTLIPAEANGSISGSFTVPDAAISDGEITQSEITTYSFSDVFATFKSPSLLMEVFIPVSITSGSMTASGILAIPESDPDPPVNIEAVSFFTGVGLLPYYRDGDAGGPGFAPAGHGSWTVSHTSAVDPEPPPVQFTPTDTPASLGLTVSAGGGQDVGVVADPQTPGNYVLRLFDAGQGNGGDDIVSISKHVGVPFGNDLLVGFKYRFVTDGKLEVLIDGVSRETIFAPASGPGRDSLTQFSKFYAVGSENPSFELRLSNVGDPEIHLDDLQVGPTAAAPEPASLGLVGIGMLALLAYRWRVRKVGGE